MGYALTKNLCSTVHFTSIYYAFKTTLSSFRIVEYRKCLEKKYSSNSATLNLIVPKTICFSVIEVNHIYY